MSVIPPNEAETESRRWRRVERIWAEVAHVPADEREAWLRRACGGDAEVEAEVRALLQAGEEVGDRFERMIGEALGELDEELPATEVLEPGPHEREDATESSDLTGMRFGYVRIQSRLGQGGMGRVYRGIDERLGREVALKVLRPELASNRRMAKRLKREARLLSQLNHPTICQLYDVIQMHGATGLVLELVEGRRLSSVIADGIDRSRALEWAAVLAEVLAAAHEAGIVHRDLKPSNVMVTPEGTLKVLDFGIARTWEAVGPDTDPLPSIAGFARAPEFTRTGEVLGTLLYMSPEQARGEPVTPATDIFSLGLILHELLSGQAAYAPTRHQANLSRAVLGGEVPPLDGLPTELSNLLGRLTAAAPGARPSAHDAAERLRSIQRAPRRRRRRVLQRTAVAVVLALALAAAWQARRAAQEAARARDAALAAERMATFLSTVFQSRSPWRLEPYPDVGAPELETEDIFLRGLAKLEEGLDDEPALQARLLLAASEVALDLELDDRALRTAQKSLDLRRSFHGEKHPEVAESLFQVADGLYFAGRLEEGLTAAREARSIQRGLGGPVTESSCWTLVSLSRLANEYGVLEEAEGAAREAVDECSAIWPVDSIEHAEMRVFFGQALMVRGRRDGDPEALAEALRQFRSAAEIQRSHLGPNHPLVAMSDASVARTLLWQGEVPEAEALFRDSIQRLEMALGTGARETDLIRNLHAETLRLGGSIQEALERHERVALRIEAESGPEHLDLLSPLRAWSRALIDDGDYAAAESRLRRALRIGGAHLPEGHWELRELQVLHGRTLRHLGRAEAAEARFREASRPEEPGVDSQAARRARQELADLRSGFSSPPAPGGSP